MGHTYCNLLVHTVFSTKDRRPVIHDSFRQRLHEYMGGVARGEFGRAMCIGGTDNHVHALLSMNTTVCIAEAMRKWKSLSSGWVHDTFHEASAFSWQEGYGVFSVSRSNAKKVVRYIEAQAEHHRRLTFEEEFIALLDRHGIEYDPQRIWA
jgi:REP element-mobilizing transposase RayT